MVILTEKEKESLLILFKDFSSYYNANSLSKKLGISHVGAQKILKRFKEKDLTTTRHLGKSIIHKLKVNDDYKKKLLSFVLADEANNFKRWKDEFKALFKKGRIVMIYGSAIKNYKTANDIDIMIITKKSEADEVNNILNEKAGILPKEIHAMKLTEKDLLKNIKEQAVVDIIKNAIVLYGYDEFVEVVKNVSSF
jgi:hypothetical protein